MSKLQLSYSFAIAIAMSAAVLACQSSAPANSGSNAPVMGITKDSAPNHQNSKTRKRVSVEYTTTNVRNRTFLIQTTQWDDNSKSKTLAAVWLDNATPVEIILVDNFTPQAPKSNNNSEPLMWDTVPPLENFAFRATPIFVNAKELIQNSTHPITLPQCEKNEIRALARIPAPTEIQRTIPSALEDLAQKRLTENVLQTANLVCLSFPENQAIPK